MKDITSEDIAMKVMKSTTEKVELSEEEVSMLENDEETQKSLQLLAAAQRSMLEATMHVPDVNGELAKIINEDEVNETSEHRNLKGYIISAVVGAAAMIALVLGYNYFSGISESADKIAKVETGSGETMTINLADGTEITLNDNSSIEYPHSFTGTDRIVKLSGEALFKVSKNKHHPFIVETNQIRTRVLGTVFDVKAYPGMEASVALVEGKVEVKNMSSGKVTNIIPGQQYRMNMAGKADIKKVNTDETTAWSDGVFYYDNKRLEDIMYALGRWYNRKVVFKDSTLKDIRLNFAAERKGSIQETVELLNSLGKVKVTLDDEKIVIE